MQLIRQTGNYIERIIRDKNGRLVRATFFVYENAGHVKARLVNFKYVEEILSAGKSIFALPGQVSKEVRNAKEIIFSVVSPYFTLNTLYSFGSKPRAPTL